MIEELNQHQPHIVINTGDKVHVVSVKTIRDIASGNYLADNELVRAIASALLTELDL